MCLRILSLSSFSYVCLHVSVSGAVCLFFTLPSMSFVSRNLVFIIILYLNSLCLSVTVSVCLSIFYIMTIFIVQTRIKIFPWSLITKFRTLPMRVSHLSSDIIVTVITISDQSLYVIAVNWSSGPDSNSCNFLFFTGLLINFIAT